MNNILTSIKESFLENNMAKIKNLLPELFRQADEGKIVELPCKVGTKLWHIYDKDKGPQECYASEDNIFLIAKRINEMVFFTREAAEKALKESEKS